jgi:hypothetical protein
VRPQVVACALVVACGRVDFDPIASPVAIYAAVQTGSISALVFDATGLHEIGRTMLATPVDQSRARSPTAKEPKGSGAAPGPAQHRGLLGYAR